MLIICQVISKDSCETVNNYYDLVTEIKQLNIRFERFRRESAQRQMQLEVELRETKATLAAAETRITTLGEILERKATLAAAETQITAAETRIITLGKLFFLFHISMPKKPLIIWTT